MRALLAFGVSCSVVLSTTHVDAFAQNATQWRVQDGGNGHWYQLKSNPQ